MIAYLCCLFAIINLSSAVLAPVKKLNDGNEMPMFVLGTHSLNDEEAKQAVHWAIEAGYRNIDTATIYENEEQIGQAVAEAIKKGIIKREDIFITTKVWNDKHSHKDVVPALKESLKKLNMDYVDLYLIHFPIGEMADDKLTDIDYLETWKGMIDAKKLNLTKSIGVSNFNSEQLDRIVKNSGVTPAVNQIEVNPTLTNEVLVSYCLKNNIAVMAHSALGFLVPRERINEPPPKFDDPVLKKIADKYGKSTSQVVLRYLVDRGTAPVVKSAHKDRLIQNINIYDFKLTDEEVATINKFNINVRVIDGIYWYDHPYYPFNKD